MDNLWGLEIKPKIDSEEMGAVLQQASPDIGSLLGSMGDMSPPGIDEAMAFGKVLEFLQDSEYDLVILRHRPDWSYFTIIKPPDMLSGWMGKILSLRLKMGKLFSGFKSLFTKDQNDDAGALESLNHLKKAIDAAKVELSDPKKTSFVIVMISELMAIYETERLLSALITYDIPVQHMIVNQIVPSKCRLSIL